MKSNISAKDIVEILKLKHPPPLWNFFSELRVGTGYKKDAKQRLDAWAIHNYPSKKHLKVAYEIKIFRGDWLKEIKNSNKRQIGLKLSNQFYYVAISDVIKLHEIPEECGYIEIQNNKSIIIKEAPLRTCSVPTWNFLSSISRRINKIEIFNFKEISDEVLKQFMEALSMGNKSKLNAMEYALFHYLDNEIIARSKLKRNKDTIEKRKYNKFVNKIRDQYPLLTFSEIDRLWAIEIDRKKLK